MKRFLIIICTLLLQACSMVGHYSTYSTELCNGNKDFYDRYKRSDIIVQDARCSIYPFDSISFKFDRFNGGVILFSGLPYIPVIPNFILPFNYLSNNKRTDYSIIIPILIHDLVHIDKFCFYRNGKQINPDSICVIDVLNNKKTTVIKENNVSNYYILSGKYQLSFIFKIKKMTTKNIEIRYNNKMLVKVKRNKKLYHEIVFAS